MARRRKEKSLAEAVAGFVMMVVAFSILSPVFRGQVISALSMALAIALLIGVVALIVYLVMQLKKKEPLPAQPLRPIRRSAAPLTVSPVRSDTPQYSPDEQARIQEVIQSMQPATYSQNQPPSHISWDETVLTEIEWKRFEVVTKEFLKMTGYEAHETNVGADGGVDIRVTKPAVEGFKGIVQCKAWNTYKVGVKPVRELFGIMAAEQVKCGMLITSGSFTSEAEDFAVGKITLVSGAKFLELIRKLSEEKQQKLLEIALEGDYKTPTCPQCDVKMKLREGKKGGNSGSQFWGCVRYPRCRQTLKYKQ
jgi:restriction system protein